jgi:hypothetical protein
VLGLDLGGVDLEGGVGLGVVGGVGGVEGDGDGAGVAGKEEKKTQRKDATVGLMGGVNRRRRRRVRARDRARALRRRSRCNWRLRASHVPPTASPSSSSRPPSSSSSLPFSLFSLVTGALNPKYNFKPRY